MNILPGIEIVDLGLYLTKERTLVIADTHIGFEEALNKQGLLVPRFQFDELVKRLKKILAKVKPKLIIVNGDIKHEFGTISEQEWRLTLRLLDFLAEHCEKIVLIKGNHDTVIGPIAVKRNIEVKDYYLTNKILIVHGHTIFEKKLDYNTIIIGHEHPAIGITEAARRELFKCFLKGKFKVKNLVVMPSFNLVTEGTNVLKESLLSPYLKQDLSGFEVFVVGDKVYKFGRLGNL
ncbi:phosphoesterase [Candidatus Woesearchaeota archaeon]|nr:phosphoesterase [Candidatus Woesearchaeota archaeon]|tara:strand:- start:4815 stop:5516 length:702 start_codon:yes stop_codon:yes gene_type:complete